MISQSPSTEAKKRVLWVVSEPYYPEEVGTAYVMTGLAEGFVPQFEVHVLCVQPAYVARGVKAPAYEERNGVQIHRGWSTTLSNDRLQHRLINLLTASLSIFLRLLWRLRRGDLVLVVTSPPSLPFFARLAAGLHRAPCVLLVHDVHPDEGVAAGLLSPRAWSTRLLLWASHRLYRACQRIVVIGRDMQALIQRKTGRPREEIVVICNWGDCDTVYPQPRQSNALLAETGLLDKFVVQYAGNMAHPHNIEALIEVACRLRGHDQIRFLVLGSGKKRPLLEKAIAEHHLDNVVLLRYRPRQEALTTLNACDLSLSLLIPGMGGLAVPSRSYQILAAGKPLIAMCDPGAEVGLLVEEEKLGWVVPATDPAALERAILEAYADPQRLAEMGRRARRVVEQQYTRGHAVRAFTELLRRLDEKPGAGAPQASAAPATSGPGQDVARRFYDRQYAAGIYPSANQPEKHSALPEVEAFVERYGLQPKRCLEIGCGREALQDVVRDYTGLDLPEAVGAHLHKPFVRGSATELPFADESFDAIWTIAVLEHIPDPEKALAEMRRVLRPGGLLLLSPAWQCRSWAAQGYPVRPYRDLDWRGKLIKASIPLRNSVVWRGAFLLPRRLGRLLTCCAWRRPLRFRYRRLKPNYDHFWMSDSDAVNGMDPYEAILWFTSRGDACLSYPRPLRQFFVKTGGIVFQKDGGTLSGNGSRG